jgi:hypothetical protein
MNLTRKPLPKASAPVVSETIESQVLGEEQDKESAIGVHVERTQEGTAAGTQPALRQFSLPNTLLPRKRREVMVSRSYRLPVSVANRLETVCRDLDYVINDVVIDAINRQLDLLTKG